MMSKSNLELVQEELAPYLVKPDMKEAFAADEERLTMDVLKTAIEETIAKKFGNRYLLPGDIGDLQTAVRTALKKRYKNSVVNLRPLKGGGFAVEVEGL